MQDWTRTDDGDETKNRTTDQDCQRCGEPVGETFRRVYGDNSDTVYACYECIDGHASPRRVFSNGGAASPERRDAILEAIQDRAGAPGTGDQFREVVHGD